jgi:hypothetical protein
MKSHVSRTILVLVAASLLSLPAQAQQGDETRIRELRIAVQAMVSNPPAADALDAPNYQRRLDEILVQLQRLLLKKTGSLETRISGLRPAANTVQVQEQIAELSNELQSVETEIEGIDRRLGQGRRPMAMAPPPAPGPRAPVANADELSAEETRAIREKLRADRESRTREREARTRARNDFDEKVAGISAEALGAAALSPAVNSPAPSCNERGRPAVLPYSRLDEALCRLGKDVGVDGIPLALEREEANILTILIAKLLKTKANGESYSSFVTQAQELRTDQQMGAGPTSDSSTSLVSKGGIPYLFGFAVENGAAEQTQDDTSVTFRFNPGGVINMFADKGFITGFQGTSDPFMKFLSKTSIGLTFDTSRGDTPGTFTGNRQQLSQVHAQVEFLNERDPRHKRYLADWERFVADEGVKLAQVISKTTVALTNWAEPGTGDRDMTFKDPALQAWLIKTQEKVGEVDSSLVGVERINAVAKVISEQSDQLPIDLVSEEAVNAITDFAAKNKTYIEKKNELMDNIAKGKILALDYTNKREINAPDTSTFNFIAGTGTAGRVDLTANGSFTFFHSRPLAASLTAPRPGTFRDFQFAGQLTVPFRSGFDLWFSGRFERLLEDATTFGGGTIPDTKGNIAIGQFGLNIPIKSLGIKFPVSFTFANRTEFVKEKEVRGNFGFTFNWDTLFSKLKPF